MNANFDFIGDGFPSEYASKILAIHDYVLFQWINLNRWLIMKVARKINSPVLYQIMNEKVQQSDSLYKSRGDGCKKGKEYLLRVLALRRGLAYTCSHMVIEHSIMQDKDRIRRMIDRRAIRRVYSFLRSWSIYYRAHKIKDGPPTVWNGTENRYFSGKKFIYIYKRTRNEMISLVQGESDRRYIDVVYYCMLLHPISLALLISSFHVITIDFFFLIIRMNLREWLKFFIGWCFTKRNQIIMCFMKLNHGDRTK